MIREGRFLMSRKQYAVDLSSLRTQRNEGQAGPFWFCTIDAVWFRRRRRGGFGPSGAVVTVACIGTLWNHQRPEPADAEGFLQAFTDGRHGGDCAGRWDGTGYWGAEDLDVQAEHLAALKPMLAAYEKNPKAPALQDRFDGWWRFHG